MKTIMILGASILQLPAIEKAKDMGLQVIAVDMNPDAIGFKVPNVVKEVISTIDIPKILDAAKKHKIDGIMTLATDMPMRAVAEVSSALNLVGIDTKTAYKATNKAAMRMALKEAGVPVPLFFEVKNLQEYYDVIKFFESSFIVKPVDSSGSRGIYKVEDSNDRADIEEAYKYCVLYSNNGNVIVEEYMNGEEVSVETLSVDGNCHVIQITDKITTGAPHFVEMGHSQPTMKNAEVATKIEEIAKAANRAIGIVDGSSHTEIIVTSEGPKVVELGARLGGDNITTHLVPLSTGVDMVECCINIALEQEPDIAHKFEKGSAIKYFTQSAGVIKNIQGIEEAEKINGVKQISIVHDIGSTITEIDSSGARMGFVIAQGQNAKNAIRICEKALKKIKVEIG